jgi:hypothetical protein
VPANHLQAEDRPYRLGQRERVTVEYMLADGTLDVYIADLLETKLRLISAVETEVPPDGSMLEDLYNRLRALGPALLQETRIASGSAAVLERLEKLAAATPRAQEGPLLSGGVQEFRSSRDPKAVYRNGTAERDASLPPDTRIEFRVGPPSRRCGRISVRRGCAVLAPRPFCEGQRLARRRALRRRHGEF